MKVRKGRVEKLTKADQSQNRDRLARQSCFLNCRPRAVKGTSRMSGITEGKNHKMQPADERNHQQDHSVPPASDPSEQMSQAPDEGNRGHSSTPFVTAFQSIASYYSRPNSPTVLFSGYPINLQTPSFEEVDRAAAHHRACNAIEP